MTDTRITVDVSTEALLQRAREQQSQSRQAVIQRQEEQRQVEQQKRERARKGTGSAPGQDRLQGRSRLRSAARRHEVAAGYVPGGILCIAVLDESDYEPAEFQAKWQAFRLKYGRKRKVIVLCVSYFGYGYDVQSSFVQTARWDESDYVYGIPFPMPYDQIKRYRVTRNNAPIYGDWTPEAPSVWQDVLSSELRNVGPILLSVDNSGSMTKAQVQESYDSFVQWANTKKVKLYDAPMSPDEHYITPFDVKLQELQRIYPQ